MTLSDVYFVFKAASFFSVQRGLSSVVCRFKQETQM